MYAFFHHSAADAITCIDRTTGSLCPGYPIATNIDDELHPGARGDVGTRIYMRLDPR